MFLHLEPQVKEEVFDTLGTPTAVATRRANGQDSYELAFQDRLKRQVEHDRRVQSEKHVAQQSATASQRPQASLGVQTPVTQAKGMNQHQPPNALQQARALLEKQQQAFLEQEAQLHQQAVRQQELQQQKAMRHHVMLQKQEQEQQEHRGAWLTTKMFHFLMKCKKQAGDKLLGLHVHGLQQGLFLWSLGATMRRSLPMIYFTFAIWALCVVSP